ncbi:aldose epimerase [Pedobacter antarcticus 4BY]|uniref:Aldose epimerase n=2 Tax=Pedobacter antarcticus TaxID=34086 RepID=A0A081PL42_9SPHI|nr:aldose 1-epimerase family protein [Pedobacter antarcticus]KEQ31415.1 aldose epimerase [Pedobacter antarcticus 4BY]SFE39812.1 Galactose mutarotase [Pedobacter antarcticus]
MIFLENEHLIAGFNTKGAELQKLELKSTGLDYLWKGDPAYWGKFSPVLFPIVGALKNDSYIFENKTYSLSRHGFARDKEFEVSRPADNEIIFTLRNSAETLVVYPFTFELALHYKLEDSGLTCTYKVNNPGEKELLFSLGGHPAFAVPFTPDTCYEDHYLLFDRDEDLFFNKIEHNLISDEQGVLTLKGSKLPLNHELFKDDALVFKSLKSEKIRLANNKNIHGLEFRFSQFPFFGIWATPGADFVCLEPWCGVADGIHHNQQLRDKEGIQTLSPGVKWERSWHVSLF